MRPYELMTILAPDVPEEELAGALDTIGGYLTASGASIVHVNRESPWGRRRLAYPIRYASRDVRDGFYTLWNFDAAPEAIAEIERELRLNDRVMRHMVIALEQQIEVIVATEPEPAAAPEAAAETAESVSEDEPVAEVSSEAIDAEVATEAETAAEE